MLLNELKKSSNYKKFVSSVKRNFYPKKGSEETKKIYAKEFASSRRSCGATDCDLCPFNNSKNEGCLSSIVSFHSSNLLNVNVNLVKYRYELAGEFYLKYYCEEYEQEEMDI